MRNLRNSVRIMGQLVSDPNLQVSENVRQCTFSVAVPDCYVTCDGKKVLKDVQNHAVTAWGNLATAIGMRCKKGTQVAVEGRLINDSVIADSLVIIPGKDMSRTTCTVVRECEGYYGFDDRRKIASSGEVNEFLKPIFQHHIDEYEAFVVLAMSRSHQVIAWKRVSQGGTSGTVVDPKLIFGWALQQKGISAIIVAHNHPSGNLTTSQSDTDITRKLRECGKLLDCELLDHVILTPTGKHYSFADEGML